MKHRFFALSLIWVEVFAFSVNTSAQDYTKWHLPEGAKARRGKSVINEIQYSPDGTRLAVVSGIGIWIYNVQTFTPQHTLHPSILFS